MDSPEASTVAAAAPAPAAGAPATAATAAALVALAAVRGSTSLRMKTTDEKSLLKTVK
jgi:hypothetical protein